MVLVESSREIVTGQDESAMVDVVVVGAGLSGLSAAIALHEVGLSVLVLEAKDRIGGKTYSVSNGAEGVVELGAAWINDTNQSRMAALARQFGLTTHVQNVQGDVVMEDIDGGVQRFEYGTSPKVCRMCMAWGTFFTDDHFCRKELKRVAWKT